MSLPLKTTKIIIPVRSNKPGIRKENIKNISRFLYATCRQNTNTESMLAYIIEYSAKGYYYSLNNSRTNCCERLNISIDTYNKCISELLKSGLLKRFTNANGSKYGFYKLNNAICKMINAKNDIELIIKSNISTDNNDY